MEIRPIIEPVDRALLEAELTPARRARATKRGGNEIYLFRAAECPALMREVGRLREEAFRGAGGGTGAEVDIDAEDLAEEGYCQLIVWDPAAREIIGGYRFIICKSEHPKHLSTEHYFRFSDRFRREYLPHTIELGRSFVQRAYQARQNPKSLYALDNLWDGLGALIVLNPEVRYLFGKVTMYTTYKAVARNALVWFLRRYFPDRDRLVEGIHPLALDLDDPYYEELFTGADYQENYRILIRKIREFNENIPPLINAYMNLSPTMRVFDTVSNPDFGGVEETGILLTIADIYRDKRLRYTRWEGWRIGLMYRRALFRRQLADRLSRLAEARKQARARKKRQAGRN
ncbi:MAG: GNAT family N-acetyltransferase [Alistipes sp.]|nr:GNAT family N-acetyltransferase [Alistipes sp.]